jgi:transposase InsO family protein
VSVSAYYERASGRRSSRAIEDERLLARIKEVHEAKYSAYGYRRTWKALLRTGEVVGRDRVRRLMRQNNIQGAKRRGKPWRITKPIRRPHGRVISFNATSPRGAQTRSGSPTSPACAAGRAWCSSAS